MPENSATGTNEAHQVRMKPMQAFAITCMTAVFVALYIVSCALIGITSLFGGFIFSIYWLMIREGATSAFVPGVVGALTGIFVAYLIMIMLTTLPPAIGVSLTIGLSLLTIFLTIGNYTPLFTNMAFVIFLTLATIPKFQNHNDLIMMAAAVVYGAAYLFVIRAAFNGLTSLKNRKAAKPAAA